MMLEIKKADLNDFGILQKLNSELFNLEFSNKWDDTLNCDWPFSDEGKKYYKWLLTCRNCVVFLAKEDSKVLGYLAGSVRKAKSLRNVGKIADLENMFISEEARGKGVGTALMNEFLKWCKGKKAKRIKVVASFLNKNAINFYKKNGFFEFELELERDI